jgi:hypothetical protein
MTRDDSIVCISTFRLPQCRITNQKLCPFFCYPIDLSVRHLSSSQKSDHVVAEAHHKAHIYIFEELEHFIHV